MFLVKKMHGKQITESLDLPNHEPTGQQAGHMVGEVAPFFSFNVKRTVEMVQICFLIPFCSSCCLSTLASHISSTGPFHLLTLFPCSQAGLVTTALATRWGVGNHNHPFLLPDKTILRGLFWLLWLLWHWRCWELPGWSSPRATVGFCIPSFSPGAALVYSLPVLTLLSAGMPGICAAELWSG